MTIRFISISYNESVVLHRQSFPEGWRCFSFISHRKRSIREQTDGHINFYKDCNMILITLDSLVEMGARVKLEISPADLKMFAESVAQRMLVAYDDGQIEQTTRREDVETYYNTKQVRELFHVCDTALNLWAKRGYLVPVKFGNRNMYTKTDIDRIRTGRRADTVSAYCRKKQVQP